MIWCWLACPPITPVVVMLVEVDWIGYTSNKMVDVGYIKAQKVESFSTLILTLIIDETLLPLSGGWGSSNSILRRFVTFCWFS